MSDDHLEDQIRQTLAHRSEHPMPARTALISEAAVHRAQRRRRRQMTVGVAASAAAIVAAGPLVAGALDDTTSVVVQPVSPSIPSPAPSRDAVPPRSGATTACADAEAPPRDTEVDTFHDRDREIIEFRFGDSDAAGQRIERFYAIAYRTDMTCQDNPKWRGQIKHVLDTGAAMEAEERASQGTPASRG